MHSWVLEQCVQQGAVHQGMEQLCGVAVDIQAASAVPALPRAGDSGWQRLA